MPHQRPYGSYMYLLSIVLQSLIVMPHHVAVSAEPDGTPYLSFGVTQLYESNGGVWFFFDVESVNDSQASEGLDRRRELFVALSADASDDLLVWRSSDRNITANANVVRFVQVDGAVYAVRRDLQRAWRLAVDDGTKTRIAPVNVGAVAEAIGGYDSLKEALDTGHTDGGLELKEMGNFGYGDVPPNAYTSSSKQVKISFRRMPGTLGWQTIIVTAKTRQGGAPETIRFDVGELASKRQDIRRKSE